jgi:hypothetical protein
MQQPPKKNPRKLFTYKGLLFSAEREVHEPNALSYWSSIFYIQFLFYGVRLRAHLKMAAFGLALTAFVAIKLRFKDTTNFQINNYFE